MGCGEKFAYVDILQNPEIRANLPQYANWPTFPQLWVAGELVGGSDIMSEMFEKGELQTADQEAACQGASLSDPRRVIEKPRHGGFFVSGQVFSRPSATAGSSPGRLCLIRPSWVSSQSMCSSSDSRMSSSSSRLP